MIKKKLFVFSIVFFSITFNSFSIEPDIFVQSTVNRASKLLGEDITKDEKIKKLKLIAKETVDIRGIGFYTLGQKRKSLNEKEKKRYAELFEEYFLKSFSSRLAEYTNPEIDVQSKEKLNENHTHATKHAGEAPFIVHMINDDGSMRRIVSKKVSVSINNHFITMLKDLIGESNVWVS